MSASTANESDAVIAALSHADEERVREAVRVYSARFRSIDTLEDPVDIAERLLVLAHHRSGKVRQAVADAIIDFPDPLFDRALAVLVADSDAFVQRAAQRAADRRAVRRKRRKREEATEGEALSLLERIGEKSKSAKKLAERAIEKDRELFVQRLHHELVKIVTPLQASIASMTSELERPGCDRLAALASARTANERLHFMWSVIETARAWTSTVTPDFRDESVAGMIDEAHGQLLDRLGERSARVVVQNDVDPKLRIEAHRHVLLQAFQNVLQNGAEATLDGAGATSADDPGVTLRVSAKTLRAASLVAITFADDGPGMTGEQKQDLFVPFRSHKPGGRGLGLLVVRKMVEEVHGGTLAIESTRGQGTTVTITLPARQLRGASER